jgi:transcriptional regulator with XRE-family HTH domain
MTTPDRLKAARGNLSQAKAAALLDIPLRTWEDWERGARTPPEYVIALIEMALNIGRPRPAKGGEKEKKMTHINLSQDAIATLAGYATEITEYNNPQYRYDIGIWADGTVSRGDLHISASSFSRWHDEPTVRLYVHPIYTTADIHDALQERGEDTDDIPQDELDAWNYEANTAARSWASEIAEQLAGGINPDTWRAPTPQINW